jgi:hypothetical protein
MIISHQHKYIFIQIPRTASTAIGDELCLNYDGKRVLDKHSLYFEFEKVASAEEKKYFIFACVRNPLDGVVGQYYKYNHMETFTTPKYWKKNGGNGWVTNKQLSQYQWITENNASFEDFFLKYYRIPYDSWISIDTHNYDYVMNFETIEQDFNKVLNLLKISPKRSLPFRNKTSRPEQDIFSHFTPEIQQQALFVFGPFLKKWKYKFPEEWNNQSTPWLSQMEFELLGIVRKFHRKYIKKERGSKLPMIFSSNLSRETIWSNQTIKSSE